MKSRSYPALFLAVVLMNPVIAPAATITHSIDGKKELFYQGDDGTPTITASCRKPDGRWSCSAYRAWSQAGKADVSMRREGGQNPGARLCDVSGGIFVIARDTKRNETSFCKFNDGSIISNASLYVGYQKTRR